MTRLVEKRSRNRCLKIRVFRSHTKCSTKCLLGIGPSCPSNVAEQHWSRPTCHRATRIPDPKTRNPTRNPTQNPEIYNLTPGLSKMTISTPETIFLTSLVPKYLQNDPSSFENDTLVPEVSKMTVSTPKTIFLTI
jgi:hypothetical protein